MNLSFIDLCNELIEENLRAAIQTKFGGHRAGDKEAQALLRLLELAVPEGVFGIEQSDAIIEVIRNKDATHIQARFIINTRQDLEELPIKFHKRLRCSKILLDELITLYL